MTPDGWRSTSLGDLLDEIDAGWSPQCAEHPALVDEWGVLKLSAITSGQYIETENKALPATLVPRPELEVRPGDLLLARASGAIDLVGRTVFVQSTRSRLMISDKILRLRPKPDIALADFLNALLSFGPVRNALTAVTGGSHMRNVSQRSLRSILVPCPPIAEQQEIAAILSAVDDAIDTTQAVIDQLEVVMKALMAELLTRGLPGRHTRFKQTEIGEVPESWEVVELGSVGEWLSGGTPSKDDPTLWGGAVPWVSPKDMKRARICDAIDHVSHAALQRGTRLAPVGSVFMVVRGMILAHTFPVALTTAPVAFNQDIKALVPAPEFDAEFLLYWLQSNGPEILKLTDVSNHGTKRLPSELLFGSKIPKAPLTEQREAVAILRTLDERMVAETEVCAQLRETRASLLSALLTGEVRVTPDKDPA